MLNNLLDGNEDPRDSLLDQTLDPGGDVRNDEEAIANLQRLSS